MIPLNKIRQSIKGQQMYTLSYLSKKGAGMQKNRTSLTDIGDELVKLFNRRIEARLTNDSSETIGRVYRENGRWNYFYEDFKAASRLHNYNEEGRNAHLRDDSVLRPWGAK